MMGRMFDMLGDGSNKDYGVKFEENQVATFTDGVQGTWKVIDS